MKSVKRLTIALTLCVAVLASLVAPVAAADTPLETKYTYAGGGMTFEKISHVNTGLEQPDGIVDYAGNGSVAVYDPNTETTLEGDRGQSYSYAAASYGDWVYIGTMYGGLGASNIISNAFVNSGMDRETALALVDTMYNGRLYTGEPDGKNAGGLLLKFNVKTGETKILLSKDLNGIIPTFRSACEMNGKLYFVGMIQDVQRMRGQAPLIFPASSGIDLLNESILYQNGIPVIYEVDPTNDEITCVYDCTEGDNAIFGEMVKQNMFTSTRAIGLYRNTLIAGCMDENGPFLCASADPSTGQDSFSVIATMDDLFNYPAYHSNDANAGGGIYQVVEYNGKLYVAIVTGTPETLDPETGTMQSYAIVRGECKGDPTVKEDWEWTVLVGDPADGAKYPFGLSESRVSSVACTLQIYNGHLYIGEYNDTSRGLRNFITKKDFSTMATNLEQSINLYRMDKNENIEMVVGDANETFPEGSISGWGSGYDSHMNQYHWQTIVHEGKMYISTMDATSLLEPLVQFLNGDYKENTDEEWDSQIAYIKNLMDLMSKETADSRVRTASPDPEFHELYLQLMASLQSIRDQLPEEDQPLFDLMLSYVTEENVWDLVRSQGYMETSVAGFDLYVLEENKDGSVSIETVSTDGFGDANNHGLRVFAETNSYMVIGTANPFYGTQLWRTPNACLRDEDCPIAAFTDADPTAWYHDGVHYALENGLMEGVSDTEFAPNEPTSRAMIVTMLWRLEGEPMTNHTMTFRDVSSGTWYTEAIRWASANRIIDGYSSELFGPTDIITREQMATILYRYAKYKDMDVSGHDSRDLFGFKDTAEISSWAMNAIQWACGESLLQGSDQKLDPKGGATRAQAATVLYRLMN